MQRAIAAGAVVLMSACSSGLPGDESTSLVDGIEQHVSITPVSPTVGDALTVRSVLVNRGNAPVTVSTPVNALRMSGVGFVHDTLPGGMLDVSHTIAPGDSLVAQVRTNPITSKAGDYLFFVQQLSSPVVGVTIHLRVKAPRTPR